MHICIIYATERVERFAYLSICTIGIGRGFAKVTGKELEFCEKREILGQRAGKDVCSGSSCGIQAAR